MNEVSGEWAAVHHTPTISTGWMGIPFFCKRHGDEAKGGLYETRVALYRVSRLMLIKAILRMRRGRCLELDKASVSTAGQGSTLANQNGYVFIDTRQWSKKPIEESK